MPKFSTWLSKTVSDNRLKIACYTEDRVATKLCSGLMHSH